jgi:hypothetical protein
MKKGMDAVVFLFFLLAATGLFARSISNSYIGLNTSDTYFTFNMGTCPTCSPAGANLLYNYSGGTATSHMVVKVNNTPYDLENLTYCPVSGTVYTDGSGLIRGVKKVANLVNVVVWWQFVNNPATGSPLDTLMIETIITNITHSPVNVALRLELDTQVIGNDGTNISVDNGFTVISKNTSWRKTDGAMPPTFWDFDVNPVYGTPTLVGRGYTYGNVYGAAATQPDIMEIANWVDVSGTAQWSLAAAGNDMITPDDSAVVLWWCNGDETSNGYTLPASNSSVVFTTYYGLNRENMLTTPTVTGTGTPGSTATETVTAADTYTATPDPTSTGLLTATYTVTVTDSNTPSATITATASPTATQSWTAVITATATRTRSATSTFTETPLVTVTDTATATQSSTATLSPTFTRTYTVTFTVTQTASFTETATCTMTFTISPTLLPSGTITPTATETPGKTPFCFQVLGAFPNPFNTKTKIFYKVCVGADVDAVIYTASGEIARRIHRRAAQGWNSIDWDGKNDAGKNAASGVFVYCIEAVSGGERQKLWGKVAQVK